MKNGDRLLGVAMGKPLLGVITCILLPIIVGVPIISTWKALLLLSGWLIIATSNVANGWKKIAAIICITLATVGAKSSLPRADIADGHNLFLYLQRGEAIERSLPPQIFENWRRRFDTVYPPDQEPYSARSEWRRSGVPPSSFSKSSDAIWREARYSRQVDSIAFNSLATFRGGFANELQYNFWSGELSRPQLPFYIMYELSEGSVGSRLTWIGQVFWEDKNGNFEFIEHREKKEREIKPEDVGKRIFVLYIPKTETIYFEMKPSRILAIASLIDGVLSILGTFAIVRLSVSFNRRQSFFAIGVAFFTYALTSAYNMIGPGKYLGYQYNPHGGGDDGLVHDSWGRSMARMFGEGDIIEALMGQEPVYWFTPGMRYFRMVEKLLFGDTNLGIALVVSCIPLVIFYLLNRVGGRRVAWIGLCMILCTPVGNLSFVNYVVNAKLGYAESVSGFFFFGGLLTLIRQLDKNISEPKQFGAFLGAVLLVLSGFLRPNYFIAVAAVGVWILWVALKRRDPSLAVAIVVGLGTGLLIPLHNWYYGSAFYLISKSGATVSITLSTYDYFYAFVHTLAGQSESMEVKKVREQLHGWLLNPGFVPYPAFFFAALVAQAAKLISLVLCVWIAISVRTQGAQALWLIAITALAAQAPMLFIFTTHYRYAMLGWDLALIATLLWLGKVNKLRKKTFLAPCVEKIR